MQCCGQQGLLALTAATQAEQQVRLLLPNCLPCTPSSQRPLSPHEGQTAASLGQRAGRAGSQGHCRTAPNQSAPSGLTILLSLGKQHPPPSPSNRSFTARFQAQNLGDPGINSNMDAGIIFSLVMFSSKEKLCGHTHLRQMLNKNVLCPLSSIQHV